MLAWTDDCGVDDFRSMVARRATADGGAVEVAGETFALVGSAVPLEWRTDRHGGRWKTSIDLVLIDAIDRLAVLELKKDVRGYDHAWSVLCQVSFRAVELPRRYRPHLAERVHRSAAHDSAPELRRTIATVFDRPVRALPAELPVARRFVMARSYPRAWPEVARQFGATDVVADGTLDRYLSLRRPPREMQRWERVDPAVRQRLLADPPTVALTADGGVHDD